MMEDVQRHLVMGRESLECHIFHIGDHCVRQPLQTPRNVIND